MENYTATCSLADIMEKTGYKPIKLNDLSHSDMETTIKELIQKNSELTSQLRKALTKISKLKKQRSALLDVIVKINNNEDSEEDHDSDLSVGDLNSEDDSSDEVDHRKRPVQPEEDEDFEEEYKPKRRRTASGRRTARGSKVVEVPKDADGNYILPFTIGGTTLLSLGEIIPNANFYNQNYIFPVGYSSQRLYKSMVAEDDYTMYTCSIDKDENDKPLFCITAADAPHIIIEKPTASAAWSEVLKRSNLLRKKKFSNTVSGPEYFGLAFKTTKMMIQELPGAKDCVGYQMVEL